MTKSELRKYPDNPHMQATLFQQSWDSAVDHIVLSGGYVIFSFRAFAEKKVLEGTVVTPKID